MNVRYEIEAEQTTKYLRIAFFMRQFIVLIRLAYLTVLF